MKDYKFLGDFMWKEPELPELEEHRKLGHFIEREKTGDRKKHKWYCDKCKFYYYLTERY